MMQPINSAVSIGDSVLHEVLYVYLVGFRNETTQVLSNVSISETQVAKAILLVSFRHNYSSTYASLKS